ncbi:hypothetical protein AVEN_205573-1 [Araneus ventricosus]|uniref:Uncharacterized protein n=1 Tax=Araneus ventricosus TaxID=182803 RepID=A0A4Y2UYQ6_ARAVE|nr:hypothetical protein AVEN_205573-1 [Araneus ventricosus]
MADGSRPVLKQRECYFWDEPHHFEPWSDDGDDTCAGPLLSKLPHHTNGRSFGPDGFSVINLLGGFSLELGFEPETLQLRSQDLPPGLCGPPFQLEICVLDWASFSSFDHG